MVWDITKPLGSDSASLGDDQLRELKTDIQTALRGAASDGTEAKFPGADTANPTYRYRGLKGTTAARPTFGEYGLYVDTTRNVIQRDSGTAWEDVATLIPSGSVIPFYQAAAPVGWTKVVTQNDKALRVVSGGTGGMAGGTVPFSTTLAHTHTVNSHTHTISFASAGISKSGSRVVGSSGNYTSAEFMEDIGSGGTYSIRLAAHTHDVSGTSAGATPATDSQLGALAYVDVILCSKD